MPRGTFGVLGFPQSVELFSLALDSVPLSSHEGVSVSYSFSVSMSATQPRAEKAADPLERGLAAHRSGALEQAWSAYLEAARARPARALAIYHLGLVQMRRGMGLSSVPFLLRAAALRPDVPEFSEALLYARLRGGRLSDCADLLDRCQRRHVAIDIQPWLHLLQRCREGTSPADLQLAEPALLDPRQELEATGPIVELPTETPIHSKLKASFQRALECHGRGEYEKLLKELGAELEQHPEWGEGLHLYAVTLLALGQLGRAGDALKQAASLLPGRADVWDHLGIVCSRLGDEAGVIDAYEQSLSLDPLRHESWNNAADALLVRQHFSEGYQYAEVALRLNSTTCVEHELFNLGRGAQGIGDLALARRVYGRLLQIDPGYAGAEIQLGKICLGVGEQQQAVAHFDRAIAIDPDNLVAQSRLIFLHNYLGTETAASLHDRARRFATLVTGPAEGSVRWPNPATSDRTLRIGFVSGDLRRHPVGYFFQSVAEALGRSPGLELFAYATSAESDRLTERFRAAFDHWRLVARLNDDEACERIRADKVDILVDLSGHTAGHRLGIFARKPAPVQVTWLGYFGTTGLPQIDYLIAGPHDVAPAEERYFSERIWRLPHTRLCFSRPPADIAVNALPAARGDGLTFACFSDVRKMTDRVVQLWAQIVSALDGSRLLLKSAQLGSDRSRAAMAERFRAAGLATSRLVIEGSSPFEDYLTTYNRVDIVLDPFPYTGGTTTAHALWMGVPVLTLAGDRLLSRQGASMLRMLGLDDWVARNEADYQRLAIGHAGNIYLLSALRASLRARLEASPLMDASLFATDMEAAFRGMWSRWSSAEPASGLLPDADFPRPKAEGAD